MSILIACGIVAAHGALAQDVPSNILDLFDQFAAANAAAGYCVRPDGAKLKNFVPNFQAVSNSALIELKQRNPTKLGDAIGALLQERYTRIDAIVAETIDQQGCDGPKVQETLAQFHRMAEMDTEARSQRKRPPSN